MGTILDRMGKTTGTSRTYVMPPSSSNASRSLAANLRFILTVILGFGLDQFTKVLAFKKLSDWPTGYPFISGWLDFTAIENRGAVFGIGQGQRLLFILVSIAAIAFIGYLFYCSEKKQWVYQIVLGMLLAGVLGNLYDRAVFGYVRDMIYVFPHRQILHHEPFPWVFNVADSLLCVGVGFMMIYSLIHKPTSPSESKHRAEARG
jgi:signal peptidase II